MMKGNSKNLEDHELYPGGVPGISSTSLFYLTTILSNIMKYSVPKLIHVYSSRPIECNGSVNISCQLTVKNSVPVVDMEQRGRCHGQCSLCDGRRRSTTTVADAGS